MGLPALNRLPVTQRTNAGIYLLMSTYFAYRGKIVFFNYFSFLLFLNFTLFISCFVCFLLFLSLSLSSSQFLLINGYHSFFLFFFLVMMIIYLICFLDLTRFLFFLQCLLTLSHSFWLCFYVSVPLFSFTLSSLISFSLQRVRHADPSQQCCSF